MKYAESRQVRLNPRIERIVPAQSALLGLVMLADFVPMVCSVGHLGRMQYSDGPQHHCLSQEDFEFALVFESTMAPRYVTEKIVNAYLAGAIPIYWGSEDVYSIFNPASFISAADFPSFEELAVYIAAMSPEDRHAVRTSPPLVAGAAERFFSWHRDISGSLGQQIADVAANLHSHFADPSA
eukprot:3713118-Amphidinium_carterae.1